MQLKIEPEFQELIPPLTAEEYKQLEDNIIKEGCRDALVVWNGFIVDGHNRYEICQRHGVEFKTVEQNFSNKDEVMDWIDANQLGRRNLTPDQMRLLRGRRYNRVKNTHGGDRRSDHVSSAHFDHLKTADKLAKEHGVSAPTIKRDGKFYEEVEQLKEQYPEQIASIYKGEKRAAVALKEIRGKQIQQERSTIAEKAKSITSTDKWNIEQADIKTWVAPRKYDFIITDPPYPKEYLYLYETLASRASEWLKPGGAIIAMYGNHY